MKVLIELIGWANIGKTSSIKAVAKKMGLVLPDSDICDSALFHGKRVGFASMGDPGSSQEESLRKLMELQCEVIVGACRTRGATTATAIKLAAEYGYKILWTTPFNFLDLKDAMNDIYSDAMIKVIEEVIDK